MRTRGTAVDTVVAVRVNLHLKWFVRLHQRLRHLGAVAIVHVVIGRAVDEQEVSMEFVGTRDWIHLLIV